MHLLEFSHLLFQVLNNSLTLGLLEGMNQVKEHNYSLQLIGV
jgi:hypothetical protein